MFLCCKEMLFKRGDEMRILKNKIEFNVEDFCFVKKHGIIKASGIALQYKNTHKTPFIYDLVQLAHFLYPDSNSFFKLLNNIDKEYAFFTIKKKNGGKRRIYAPSAKLCRVQKIILRKILCHYPVSQYACAYIKGKNLYQNANPHTNKKYILKLDITDFFGSITFEQILSTVFNKNYYPTPVGVSLTNLCCYKETLVQGAPTSPMLSNLVMKHFDDIMGDWCAKQNIAYTRYCDDMTFSSDKPLYHVYSKASSFLESMGFELNKKKTRFITNTSRQTVTGLVVNEKVSIPKEYKRNLRKDIYYFSKYDTGDKTFITSDFDYYGYIHSLLGRTTYVLSIEANNEYFKKAKIELLKKLNLEETKIKVTLPIEGTQHPTIPPKMAKLYEELYDLLPQNIEKTELSKFFPIKGSDYKNSSPKIMIVGRCPNGWGGFEKGETAIQFLSSAADNIVYNEGFTWIDKDDHISTYVEDGETKKYNINRSAFWRVIKGIVYKTKPWLNEYKKANCALTKELIEHLDNIHTRWFENIVWTNMYPISPLRSGNTSEKLKRILKDVCADLLLEQIRFYKPTHIIFITDWDYWFSDFAEKFPNVKKISEDKNDDIVCVGEIDEIKTIVTRRPEIRNNEKMIKEIFEKLFGGSNT